MGGHIPSTHLKAALNWLEQYFSHPGKLDQVKRPTLNLEYYSHQPFLVKVWETLQDISQLGQTLSYKELACACNRPNSSRAVGMAMRKNPFPLLIPCHRVV